MLLRPGGWIIFDDLNWTIEKAAKSHGKMPAHWRACSADERVTPGVQLVFDLLVPHLGYTDARTVNEGRWGMARKPRRQQDNREREEGVVGKIKRRFASR
jgi:hypothetical protein